MTKKKYFGDLPKTSKVHERKYFHSNEEDSKEKLQSFPTARELAEYDAVFDGAAERIVKLIEKEQSHRQHWENKALLFQNFGRRLGQILFVFAIIIICYIGAGLISSESVGAGFTVIVLGLCTLASSLYFNKKNNFHIERKRHFNPRNNRK